MTQEQDLAEQLQDLEDSITAESEAVIEKNQDEKSEEISENQ
jgi:hypothetical protein